jgi:hypothetical protein
VAPPLSIFRFVHQDVVKRIYRCVDAIQDVIAPTVGIYLGPTTWTGEKRGAWSRRTLYEAHTDPPREINHLAGCR